MIFTKLTPLFILIGMMTFFTNFHATACDTSPIITVSPGIDNGDGTYDILLNVCMGDGGSDTGFITDLGGGINIVGFTPASIVDNGVATGSISGGDMTYFDPSASAPSNMFVNANTCFLYIITVDSDPIGETITFTGVNSQNSTGSCVFLSGNVQTAVVPPPPASATCGGSVTDGPGNYSNNESVTTLICPLIFGDPVTISFSQFNLESGFDFLTIYDGPTTGSPLIGAFSGTSNPADITSSDPSGCLTIVFTTDFSVTRPGYTFTVSCNLLLPVELSEFYAECQSTNKSISWTTKSEEDNDFFELMYSDDAKIWTKIAEIPGNGSTQYTSNYSFTDTQREYADFSYYQLKQVDLNGIKTLSEIISLPACEDIEGITLFPNPASSSFRIRSDDELIESIAIYSFAGRLVLKQSFEQPKGDVEFSPDLKDGIYTVRVVSQNEEQILKLIIQN